METTIKKASKLIINETKKHTNKIDSSIIQVLNIEEKNIKDLYKKGHTKTQIAKILNDTYQSQFKERKVSMPKDDKLVEVVKKPTIRVNHINRILNKNCNI